MNIDVISQNLSLDMTFTVKNHHDNIVVESLLEDFFNNFDDIPYDAIQELVDKYRKG